MAKCFFQGIGDLLSIFLHWLDSQIVFISKPCLVLKEIISTLRQMFRSCFLSNQTATKLEIPMIAIFKIQGTFS